MLRSRALRKALLDRVDSSGPMKGTGAVFRAVAEIVFVYIQSITTIKWVMALPII
jgi:hypothetical protein